MRRARVLICEDEGLTALRLKASLSTLGYEVVGEAKDGESAVAAAAQLHPDAILMDVRIPKLDGISATKEIMAEQPTAIVMITAFNDRELVESALQAGASGFLVKPVTDNQIGPALTVALNKFSEVQDLAGEVTDLKEALETRKVLDQAKGVLARRNKITEEEAYRRIQQIARDRKQTLKQTAKEIVSAAEILK